MPFLFFACFEPQPAGFQGSNQGLLREMYVLQPISISLASYVKYFIIM